MKDVTLSSNFSLRQLNMHWLMLFIRFFFKQFGGEGRTTIRMAARMDGRVMQVPRRTSFWEKFTENFRRWLPKIPWRSDHASTAKSDRYCIDLGLKHLPFPLDSE
jgi:hypothetical protein